MGEELITVIFKDSELKMIKDMARQALRETKKLLTIIYENDPMPSEDEVKGLKQEIINLENIILTAENKLNRNTHKYVIKVECIADEEYMTRVGKNLLIDFIAKNSTIAVTKEYYGGYKEDVTEEFKRKLNNNREAFNENKNYI